MNEHTHNRVKALLLWAALMVSFALPALAQTGADISEVIGHVSRVQNDASVARNGHETGLQTGAPLHLDDTVTTATAARLEDLLCGRHHADIGRNGLHHLGQLCLRANASGQSIGRIRRSGRVLFRFWADGQASGPGYERAHRVRHRRHSRNHVLGWAFG